MSAAEATLQAAEAVQEKIGHLQRALHAALAEVNAKIDEKRDAVIAARESAVKDMLAAGELPADFWASAIVSFLTLRDKQSDTMTRFLGPYDEKLLKTYLTEFRAERCPKGIKMVMKFKENPFFEETELWAELKRVVVMESDDADREDGDLPIEDEGLELSGITWKPGHGPSMDDDDEESEESEEDQEGGGRKRSRDGATKSDTEGPSMLEVFGVMPPYPEEDDELDELDDDEMAEAIDEWESEISDRKTLIGLLVGEMFACPQAAIRDLARLESTIGELSKKARLA